MPSDFRQLEPFAARHIGPDVAEVGSMLASLKVRSLDELVSSTVPSSIRLGKRLSLPEAKAEVELAEEIHQIAQKNQVAKSFIGMGYSDCWTPPVILRNVFQNPGWYTQYTPYQAEIAQGRLEALLNFQTMVADLTGLPIANASLLDEATAAAEAMSMAFAVRKGEGRRFFVSSHCHPQTIAVVQTRAAPLGIEVVVGEGPTLAKSSDFFGALVQYPGTDGRIDDPSSLSEQIHRMGGLSIVACDLLGLTLLTPPGELGADVAIGSSQRFGVPLGYGGPHAAFFAAGERFARNMPGRIIGVSQDAQGRPALRMALQTREQHIRREKATSNICTSQVLLAVIASMYAVYHGPKGLRAIAQRVHGTACALAKALSELGLGPSHGHFFDTLRIDSPQADRLFSSAAAAGLNLRRLAEGSLTISVDETTLPSDLERLIQVFAAVQKRPAPSIDGLGEGWQPSLPQPLVRRSTYLTHPVFNTHHSETEMLRYIRHLEGRDLSLTHSMIPLGSCTMKLNATSEMIPLTWPAFSRIHPFAPLEQTAGYQAIFSQLQSMLAEITGLPGVSLQPNAGSQGEYAGLLVIRAYHQSRGDRARDVCLIPSSAHGTNPASAVMAGFKVVVVRCDENGNVDLGDLEAKASEHASRLGALMITYPSTHGVFEEDVQRICQIVHRHGGQVYLDGANMNAQVGLCRPAEIGADVCHLNLHKTFAIPHGGGGPGMGPICVAAHLAKFLPSHPVVATGGSEGIGPVAAAPWGSASILLISWVYIRLMGEKGLTDATQVAILSANYIAHRLAAAYPVLYRGKNGRVAHECIVDLRPLKKSAGIDVEDVAKRLIDYGFHAPTVSFPVAGTMMIEPTESESKAELDHFCDAMLAIRDEIREIEEGKAPREGNALKNAPHTAEVVTADEWPWTYSRRRAAFPTEWAARTKFWPSVGRLNGALGDRNLVCSCPPVEAYGSTSSGA